jgi:hypothetical protein
MVEESFAVSVERIGQTVLEHASMPTAGNNPQRIASERFEWIVLQQIDGSLKLLRRTGEINSNKFK